MTSEYRHNPELRAVLRLFQLIAALGLVVSVATLVRPSASNAGWRQLLYTTWFAIAVVSVEAILHWIKAGVYALGLATLIVTIVDVFAGVATPGGASLGLLVAFILFVYLRPLWGQFD